MLAQLRDALLASSITPRTFTDNYQHYWRRSETASEGPIDVIDMFSGCGGMSAGFRAVNGLVPAFKHILAVDVNKVANRTYEANLGLQPLCADIGELAADEARLRESLRTSRRQDHPLILIGCAPCQGFSSHRNAAGEGDTRNSLFVDFAKIAVMLNPDVVVVENVPEMLTNRYWPYVNEARRQLEGAGYHTHLSVHNVAAYGVPQERFRAVLLAFRKAFQPLQGFLARSEFRTVRQTIGSLPPVGAGERHPTDAMHYSAGHKESTLETIRAVAKDGGSRPPHVGPACLQRIHERQGRSAYEDVYGRLFWDRPAITITAYARNPASGRYVHPEQDRGLTIREAALLQSFPSDYRFAGSLDDAFRQIGNAVPPVFASSLALHVLSELIGGSAGKGAEGDIRQPVGSSFSRIIPALKAGHLRDLVPGAS